jgi:hypothetical protein
MCSMCPSNLKRIRPKIIDCVTTRALTNARTHARVVGEHERYVVLNTYTFPAYLERIRSTVWSRHDCSVHSDDNVLGVVQYGRVLGVVQYGRVFSPKSVWRVLGVVQCGNLLGVVKYGHLLGFVQYGRVLGVVPYGHVLGVDHYRLVLGGIQLDVFLDLVLGAWLDTHNLLVT